MLLHQEPQESVLRVIGVLIFVDQNVAEPILIAFQDRRLLLPQPADEEEEVVEIQGVMLAHAPLIFLVNPLQGFLQEVALQPQGPGFGQLVFGGADMVTKDLRPNALGYSLLEHYLFEEPISVIAVVDHKFARVA